jgi:hypothetical protein
MTKKTANAAIARFDVCSRWDINFRTIALDEVMKRLNFNEFCHWDDDHTLATRSIHISDVVRSISHHVFLLAQKSLWRQCIFR